MRLLRKTTLFAGTLLLSSQIAFAQGRPQPNSYDSYPKGLPRPAVRVGQDLLSSDQGTKTKISKEDALKIALSNVKGELVSSKLENFGGSTCYSFDIKVNDTIKEVLVNDSGQVVIVEKGPAAKASSSPTVNHKAQKAAAHK